MINTHADRIVAEAQEALDAIDADVRQMRTDREELNARISEALEDRKPLARIVNAAKGRKGNGHGPDQPE